MLEIKRNHLRAEVDKTTTALGASATYTGEGQDTLLAKRVAGFAYADQAGTLHVEHSDDGSNWYSTGGQAVAAGATVFFDQPAYAAHARLRYVNGATAQAAFKAVLYRSAL